MNIPVILFCYNRPDHLKQVLAKLKGRLPGTLHVFSDGPASEMDVKNVTAVRRLLEKLPARGTELFFAERNLGLRASVTSGISRITRNSSAFIALEDDCVPLPGFFRFMTQALRVYEDAENVYCLSGFTPPAVGLDEALQGNQTFFWPRFWSWGWGGWSDKWAVYSEEVETHLAMLQAMERPLDAFGADLLLMLKELRAGKMDSWAVHWFLSIVARGGMSLYPARSLVENIGLDGSGRHCAPTTRFQGVGDLSCWPPTLFTFPEHVRVDPEVDARMLEFFHPQRGE